MTIVLVTHEPDIAAYAKRIVVFRDGHIVADDVARRATPQRARRAHGRGAAMTPA